LSPLEPDREFNTVEHSELRWVDGPGPGYSREKAQEILINRYINLIRPIRRTLPRLLQREEFRVLVQKLREDGYLDWQILLMISNMAVDFRVNTLIPRSASQEAHMALLGELISREETANDIEVPHEIFTEEAFTIRKQIHLVAVARTWDLVLHRDTPDFDALARLLDVRYNNSTDDIDHDDFFQTV